MKLTEEICYRALRTRDQRFDGVFFVGVSTTGIYCRPVCPARTAARSSCRFFGNAALAEHNGYRPCLRCRPELAPGLAPMDARQTTVPGIVSRIQSGALDRDNVDSLAAEFGIGARQLRRLVRDEMGVTPIELAQTCRLLLAKQLLTETSLPVTRIAFASGFTSVRRFNEAFRSHYRLTPGTMRRQGRNGDAPTDAPLRLRLGFRPPLDWPSLLAFLEPRAIASVESVSESAYARTVSIDRHDGWIAVTRSDVTDTLSVEISASLLPVLQPVLARVRNLFDLGARPDLIDAHLGAFPRLAQAVRDRPGLRVPGAFAGFELAWRAILGQQVSVRGATTLAGRFAERFGTPYSAAHEGLRRMTPTAASVAAASPDDIAAIGLPRSRAACLHALAEVLADRPTLLDPGPSVDAALQRLRAIRGIGPWTADYIAMRALRWPDAFPKDDLGLRHALGLRTPSLVRDAAEPWRPLRSYAALHLWTELARINGKQGRKEP